MFVIPEEAKKKITFSKSIKRGKERGRRRRGRKGGKGEERRYTVSKGS